MTDRNLIVIIVAALLLLLLTQHARSQTAHIPPRYIWRDYRAPSPSPLTRTRRLEFDAEELAYLREKNLLPPAEFDHPYSGKLTVVRVTQDTLRQTCGEARGVKPGVPILGCALSYFNYTVCNVMIANDDVLNASTYSYDFIFRHEIGHCNGWHH